MRLNNFVPSGPPEVPSVRKRGVRLPNLKSMEMMEVIIISREKCKTYLWCKGVYFVPLACDFFLLLKQKITDLTPESSFDMVFGGV